MSLNVILPPIFGKYSTNIEMYTFEFSSKIFPRSEDSDDVVYEG